MQKKEGLTVTILVLMILQPGWWITPAENNEALKLELPRAWEPLDKS